ncbi:MAG: hypothetical protein ACR2NU_03895 [Aeoliella sp.]
MLHLPPLPLGVDMGSIIQAIIFLVILASGVAKMFRDSKEVQKQQPRRPRQVPQQAGAPEAPQPRTPQEAIRLEVEEFLRRAGQDDEPPQREAKQSPPKRQPPRRAERRPRIEVLENDGGFDFDDRPKRLVDVPSSRPAEAAPPEPKPRPSAGIMSGGTVAGHVAKHLDSTQFAERASQLGEEVSHTDERLEARLQEKFDHGLGTLSARRKAREASDDLLKEAAAAPSLAGDLVEMLSSPQGVKQAILMNEILTRPADRW